MLPIILIIVVFMIISKISNKNRDNKLGWKAYKKDTKTFIYSEKLNGKWDEILIDRAYELGSFYPDFKSKEDWKEYPNWAQNRDLIINRVLIRFLKKKENEIDEIGKG